MPPKLKSVIANLEEFTDILLTQITDESKEGREQLVAAMRVAHARYQAPIADHFSGWIYYFTRVRGPEVNEAMTKVNQLPDAETRLHELQNLLNHGEWHIGSYNHEFFMQLINGVPGYRPLSVKQDDTKLIINQVRQQLLDKINNFIKQQTATRNQVKAREQELKTIGTKDKKTLEDAALFSNNLEASEYISHSPGGVVFSLLDSGNSWQLFWHRDENSCFRLPLIKPLEIFLKQKKAKFSQDYAVIEHIKQDERQEIIAWCLKSIDLFFAKVSVLINPKDNDPAIGKGGVFIVRGAANRYSLEWINLLGVKRTILPKEYPILFSWLEGCNTFDQAAIFALKSHLLGVDIAAPIGRTQFKRELEGCLAKGRVLPVKSKQQQVGRLNLGLFADVARVIGQQSEQVTKPERVATPERQDRLTKTLDLSQYEKISLLFAARQAPSKESLESISHKFSK